MWRMAHRSRWSRSVGMLVAQWQRMRARNEGRSKVMEEEKERSDSHLSLRWCGRRHVELCSSVAWSADVRCFYKMGGYFPTVVASLIIDVVLTWAKPCISVLTHSQEESDCLTPNSSPYIQVLEEWAPKWVLEPVSFHVVRSLWPSNRNAVPPPALTLSQGPTKEVILVQEHYFKFSLNSIISRFLIKVWRLYSFMTLEFLMDT